MNGVWRSLLWKEWREQRSSIAILTAFFVLIPTLFSLRTPTNYFGVYSMTLFVIPIMCLFVAMGIAAREQASGTIGFLQALPISPRKPASAKLFWGIISVTAPLLFSLGVAWLVRASLGSAAQEAIEWDASNYGIAGQAWFQVRAIVPPVAAVSLLLWFSAAGVNGSDEVRAGAIGLLVVVLFWGMFGLVAFVLDLLKVYSVERVVDVGMAMAPGGIVTFDLGMPSVGRAERTSSWNWFLAAMMIFSHAALTAIYVGRFGRLAPGRRQTVESATVRELPTWLAPPRRSPFAAIAWKQFRESAPLAAMGAMCITVITAIVYLAMKREAAGEMTVGQLFFAAVAIWMTVGLMVSVVAGVGVFLEDLSPGLNYFWRSRPINTTKWFVVKYSVGLLVTTVTLAVPMLAIAFYAWVAPDEVSSLNMRSNEEIRTTAVIGGLGQIVVYNCAIAAIVLLRRPIHAAFTAIVAALVGLMVSGTLAHSMPLSRIGVEVEAVMALFVVFLGLMAAALAWFAVKRDWGWSR